MSGPSGADGPDTVVWDLDGTLVRSDAAVRRALAATVRERAGPDHPGPVAGIALGPPESVLSALLGRPADPDDLAAYVGHLAAAVVRPYPGVRRELARRRRERPVAVVTSAIRPVARALIHAAGMDGLVDVLVCADDVSAPKPDPEGVLVAAVRLDRRPHRLVYVGDAARDMTAARAAGCTAAAAGWGHEGVPPGLADIVLATPAEASGLVRGSAPDPAGQHGAGQRE